MNVAHGDIPGTTYSVQPKDGTRRTSPGGRSSWATSQLVRGRGSGGDRSAATLTGRGEFLPSRGSRGAFVALRLALSRRSCGRPSVRTGRLVWAVSDVRILRRLSRKAGRSGLSAVNPARSENGRGLRAPDSGCRGRQSVSVELQQVVGGGDQAPFRADGRPTPAFEPPRASVLLDVGEDRLDHLLSL